MKESLNRRSLKRTHKQLAKAVEQRDRLIDKERLSLPSGEGILSIIVSKSPSFKTNLTADEQYSAFMDEAEDLKELNEYAHQEVRIRQRAIPTDIKMEFADPEVTDIMMIGHGSIGTLWVDDGGKLGWRDIAKSAKYLKQGTIEQRMCGNFPLEFNVPLATFAAASLDKIFAAPNVVVPDINPPENIFIPIYNNQTDLLTQINDLNSQYTHKYPIEL